MKTIKKTTLIAAITAMTAIAVPSMASAAVWGPINTNKTLTSTSSARYVNVEAGNDQFSFACANSTLGVHVRTPASSTLDITSATFTNCSGVGPLTCGAVTVTATGLPWAATWSATGVSFTEHLQVTEGCIAGTTLTVDGPTVGAYTNGTHTLSARAGTGMNMNLMGMSIGAISTAPITTWHETTNTLNLT